MVVCYSNAEGCLTSCFHFTGIEDLVLTSRYYVTTNGNLDVRRDVMLLPELKLL